MIRVSKFILFFIFFALAANFAQAFNSQDSRKITVYFFWGIGCSDCERQKAPLENLKQKYPQVEIKSYEALYNRENAEIFEKIAKSHDIRSATVPATFIDDKAWLGYDDSLIQEIEAKIEYCLEHECSDPLIRAASPVPAYTARTEDADKDTPKSVTLPFFGRVDPSKVSLPLFTVLLGGFDAFNPCAFFVLLILLSLLVRTGSRKRMLLVGGIFVFISGFIYFLFMAAWLNLFLLMGRLKMITSVAGAIAVIIAAINIKDFFFFRKGISLTIPEQAKPKLFERMRNLIHKGPLPSLILATITLGVIANIYELFCTPGFPLIYTRVLTLEKLSLLQYYLFLILYNVIYVMPLMAIVITLSFTLGQKKLTEWQGQVLKLISGLMMLFLGLILIIKPAILENIFVAASLLVLAILTGIIIIFIYRLRSNTT